MKFFIQYSNPLFSIHSLIPINGMANSPNTASEKKKRAIPCNIKYFFFRIRTKIIIGDKNSSKEKKGKKNYRHKKAN